MADFDAKLPVRAAVTDVIIQVADSGSVTIDPAKEGGNLSDIKTAIQIMDDWDDGSDRAKTNLQAVAGTAVDVNTGNVSNGTQRVVLASDQPTVAVDGPAAGLGVDVEKIKGTATAVNTGNADNGTQRVVLATDQPAIPVTLSVGGDKTNSFAYDIQNAGSTLSKTHTYTPAGTVYLTDIYASASGQMKVEIQYGLTGAEATIAVLFTSKGSLNCCFHLDEALKVLSTQTVKVIKTNMDNQAMDVYDTICVYA